MSLMKNLITKDDLRKPGYKPNTDRYNIALSIGSERILCIVANLDNNYLEWVSLGEITDSAEAIGDCVNHIISQSPNGKHASRAHTILERENIDRNDYKYLWLSTKIAKHNGLFYFCGEELQFSSEKIGMGVIEFYNSHLKDCESLEENATSITDYLSNLCSQLEECLGLDNASLGYRRSKEIENPIGFEKLKCLGLSSNLEVQKLYREYRKMLNKSYQAYMNEAR